MPKPKKQKEDFVRAVFDIVRREGYGKVNACSVGKELGLSSRPLYTWYSDLEELKKDFLVYARQYFCEYMTSRMRNSKDALYDFMRYYVFFVKEEHYIFQALFFDRFIHETALQIFEYHDTSVFDYRWLIAKSSEQNIGCKITLELIFQLWTYIHGFSCYMMSVPEMITDEIILQVVESGLKAFVPERYISKINILN